MRFWKIFRSKKKPKPKVDSSFDIQSNSTAPTETPTPRHGHNGFFPNARSFEVHGGTFMDVHTTQTTQVYSGRGTGLELLRENMAPNALHNSADRFDAPKCDEDTRLGVIEEIMNWITDSSPSTRILCMTGPAGTGKSALQQTIADICAKQGTLAASFFFSTSDSTRNTKLYLVPTLAYQVATAIPDARPFIIAAVENDPTIFVQSLESQLETLLVHPLRQAQEAGQSRYWPSAILIDGLDECHGIGHQSHILKAIHRSILNNHLPFRIFLASRPEYAIRTALDGHLKRLVYHIVLDDKYNPDADIELYLRRRLFDIGTRGGEPGAADGTWPSDEDIKTLVNNSSGQFVYAATVIKFVDQRHFSPVERLQLVFTWTVSRNPSQNPFKPLDTLYTNILRLAQDAIKDDIEDPLAIVRLVSKIHVLKKKDIAPSFAVPLTSVSFLESLLLLRSGDIRRTLIDLHALVDLSNDEIKFHHKSFTDFLEDPLRCGEFYIDQASSCTELVTTFSKHMLEDSSAFVLHPSMVVTSSSVVWWNMVSLSTLDHDVLQVLQNFDYETWIRSVRDEFYILSGPRLIRECLFKLLERIQEMDEDSHVWLAISQSIKAAANAIKNGPSDGYDLDYSKGMRRINR